MKFLLLGLIIFTLNSCNVASIITGTTETDLGKNFGVDLTKGLDFFARLDSSGDQATDFNGIYLINNFTVTQTSGKNGGAIQCDSAGIGNADGALKDTSTNIIYSSGSDFAMSFWIKMDTTYISSNNGVLIDDGSTFNILIGDYDTDADANDLYLNINAMVSQYHDIPASLGTWNHIAVNFFNGGDSRDIYINGDFYTSSSGHSQMNINATGLNLCSFYNGGNEFQGALDSVGIWSRTLSSEEIRALYSGNNNVD